ncbi:MAG: hypothetical protein M3Y93_14440, partial [Pseudomonadota bacterium]|nr:hypothetical protein [Pseudomonadota bacterium]
MIAASLQVSVESLPSGAGATAVDLSTAKTDWRIFSTSSCPRSDNCLGDRSLTGSGIVGVYHLGGGDPNFYQYGVTIPALIMTYRDGTVRASGSLGRSNLWLSSDYRLYSEADNSVVKTFTTYWLLSNQYTQTTTHSGDGTVEFTLSMSDGSMPQQIITRPVSSAAENGLLKVTVKYNAATNGQQLVMRARVSASADGNTTLSPLAAMLDSPPMPPTVRHVPMGADVQGILESARPGDTQLFPTGFTWTGNLNLVPRPKVSDLAGGYLRTIVRAADVTLARGQRVKLEEPTVRWITPNTSPVLTATGGTIGYWDFDGIRFDTSSDVTYYLVMLLSNGPDHTTTLADLPHDFTFTHVVARGRDFSVPAGTAPPYKLHAGFFLDGMHVAVEDSNVTNIVDQQGQGEANAVVTALGKNVSVVNNELSANGEVVMLYNFNYPDSEVPLVPTGAGLMPDGILVKDNYIHKDFANWHSYVSTKNLIECKQCANTRLTHNLLEYSFEGKYSQGQHGVAIAVMSRNAAQPSTNGVPWAYTHNVEVDHNIIHHVGACFGTQGPFDDAWDAAKLVAALATGATKPVSDVNIHDNYCDDVSGPIYGTYDGLPPLTTGTYIGLGMRAAGPDNFTFRNNTVLMRESLGQTVAPYILNGVSFPGYTTNFETNAGAYMPTSMPANFPAGRRFVNQVYDSNVFGADIHCDSFLNVDCFRDPGTSTFSNNLVVDAIRVPTWLSSLAT